MRRYLIGSLAGLGFATLGLAQPMTPERGTALRSDVLNAARVAAIYDLGAPIEFVVDHLVVDNDRAFAMLSAQRPGGGQIDLAQTPIVLRGDRPIDVFDGPHIVAFLIKDGGAWAVSDHMTGATDVWWAGPYCDDYDTVLPAQFCR